MKRTMQMAGHLGIFASKLAEEEQLRHTISCYWPQQSGIPLRRIGGTQDGGYLVPDCLDGIDACLSPGVDLIADFEADLECLGIRSHLIDKSIDGAPQGFEPLSFTRKFLGTVSSGDVITLNDWATTVGVTPSQELLLQMDIEGNEYASLLSTPRSLLQQCRIIVLELHHLNSLGNRAFLQVFQAFTDFLMADHTVVHLHPNNMRPPVHCGSIVVHPLLEVTLLRNDFVRYHPEQYVTEFPTLMDRACVSDEKDWPLARDWVSPKDGAPKE